MTVSGKQVAADAYGVDVYGWMYQRDGLGLQWGAELATYAAIYSVSHHGQGLYQASQNAMAEALGLSRMSVARALKSLEGKGYIYRVTVRRQERGGRATPCWVACQPEIDRAVEAVRYKRMDPSACGGGDADVEDGVAHTVENDGENHQGGRSPVTNAPSCYNANVTGWRNGRQPKQQVVTSQCNNLSNTSDCYIGENTGLPAQTVTFQQPSYPYLYLLPDKAKATLLEGGSPTTPSGHVVSEGELSAFFELCDASPLKVQTTRGQDTWDAYLEILDAVRPLGGGPRHLLSAMRDYVRYHTRVRAETGAFRVARLDTWLRMKAPDGRRANQWIMHAIDHNCVAGRGGGDGAAGEAERMPAAAGGISVSRPNPSAPWFATGPGLPPGGTTVRRGGVAIAPDSTREQALAAAREMVDETRRRGI